MFQGEVYDIMKGIRYEKYSGSNQIVLEFWKLMGNQVPTTKAIEIKCTQGVQGERYYKEYGEKKSSENNYL